MAVTPEPNYRRLRHDLRVRVSFARNYFILRRLQKRLEKKAPQRRLIAVMLLEHIGDIVACEPAVRYLREQYPKAYIVWGVKKAYRELIDSNPHIDMTLTVYCLTERILLMNSGLFDEVIDLHFVERYCSLCRSPLRKNASSHIGLKTFFKHGGILESFSHAAGLPPLTGNPMIYIPASAEKRVDELKLPCKFVAVHCTSNIAQKDWPVEKWLSFSRKLTDEYSMPVVEVGLNQFLPARGDGKIVNLCNRLTILESAEVIRRACLFIGIDSGPAHLANAVGTPGVILIGPILGFERYNPFSGAYRNGVNAKFVCSVSSVADIPVEAVMEAVSDTIRLKPQEA